MTEKQKHIHKFKRLKYKSGNEIFFCALPDCNKKSNPALLLGKRSICWRCGSEFIMNDYALRLAKPHCEGCHKPKKEELNTDREVLVDIPTELSLSERLSQTIQQAGKQEEEEI